MGIVTVAGAAGLRIVKGSRGPRKPICSCEHGFGMHNTEGRCQAGKYENGQFLMPHEDSVGYQRKFIQCPCVHYDGPASWMTP